MNYWLIFFAAFVGATVGRLLVFGIERLAWCIRDAKKYRENRFAYPRYERPHYINYNGGNYYILKERFDDFEFRLDNVESRLKQIEEGPEDD